MSWTELRAFDGATETDRYAAPSSHVDSGQGGDATVTIQVLSVAAELLERRRLVFWHHFQDDDALILVFE